jgi:hypothetical protein
MVRSMNNAPSSSPETPATETMAERHQRILRKLTDMAERLCEAAEGPAMAQLKAAVPGQEATGPDHVLAFQRLARTVRQCVALEGKVEKERLAEIERRAKGEAIIGYAGILAGQQEEKRRVKRLIDQVIVEQTPVYDLAKVRVNLNERLGDDDDWEDLAGDDRPIGAIIAGLCHDLGLDPDWSRWENEDWAIKEAETRAPGSPYADWLRRVDRQPAARTIGRAGPS